MNNHTYFNQALTLSLITIPLLAQSDNKKSDKRPNILFCIADDATYHHFSKAGCTWVNTPSFDRVASDGLFFNRCYTPNAKSAPSRAILLTGCYSWQLGEAGNHLCNFPSDVAVFTEILSQNDYSVAFTGKGWAPGFAGMVDGELRKLTGEPYQSRKLKAPTNGINSTDYASNFKDFLDSKEQNNPWFFWFGSTEPHRAYEYGTGVKLASKSVDMIDHVPPFWSDNETVRNDMLDYGFEIEYFDKQIGKMLKELEERGELDNTIVIITSDNGMPFPRCKANNYEYSTHMPMAIMWNDGLKNSGRTISDYVSFIDVAPTILEAAEIDSHQTEMKPIQGESLISIIKDNQSESESVERKTIYFGRERDDYGRPNNQGYPIRAIMEGDILYIHNIKPQLFPAGNPETGYLDIDGSPTKTDILTKHRKGEDSRLWQLSMGFRAEEEMYDLTKDRYCVNNIASDPNYADIKEKLKSKLQDKLVATKDPRLGAGADNFDYYRFNSANKWNFFERVITGEIKEPWEQTGWVNPTDYEQHPDNF